MATGEHHLARRILQLALGALLAAAMVDLAGFKLHRWAPTQRLLAGLMTAAALLAIVELALVIRELARGPRRVARAGKAAALLGLVLTWGGGVTNWLVVVRGYAVLVEGEAVPLTQGGHLQGLQTGLLADRGVLEAIVELASLELRDTEDGFYPEATVIASRPGRPDERLRVVQDEPARIGALQLHLGAFGFAPRIVVLNGKETVFDETVLLSTQRSGAKGVAFQGEAELGETGLHVVSAVKLDNPDASVRGHPTVWVSLRRGDEEIGTGDLQLGHFANAKGGYRLGVPGLKKWAEVDLSTPNRPQAALAGMALALVGLVTWGAGAWRKR